MNVKNWIFSGLFAFTLIGCGGAPTAPASTEPVAKTEPATVLKAPSSATPKLDKPATTSSAPAKPGAVTPVATQKPAATPPIKAQNDAYSYYGLANTKEMKLVMNSSAFTNPIYGGRVLRYMGNKNGKETYEMEMKGDLYNLGTTTLVLDSNGLMTVNTTLGTMDTASLELPASLKPGTTWKSSSKVEGTKDGDVQEHTQYKVIGEKQVATKVGKYTALLIVGNGTAHAQNQDVKMSTKMWYVRDRGLVKSEITMTPKDPKKAQTVTIEETK